MEPDSSTSNPETTMAVDTESEPKMIFSNGLRVAIQGCGHGALDQIYATIEQACYINSYTVDLLIICGDFQAVRNSRDLLAMAVPQKYRHMGDFYKYYNGSKTAPVPTIFVGGNHEASAHLHELNLGGWVCPNIYYLGGTGVINVNGIRIAGVSGIYNEHNYRRPRYEKPPYDDRNVRSAYHYRAHELFKLNALSGDIDIFLSHDWPEGITKYGNERWLVKVKPHFRPDLEARKLGSPPLMGMLRKLRPTYWFSGHMHIKFPAVVDHDAPADQLPTSEEANWTHPAKLQAAEKNADEIDLDLDDVDEPVPEPSEKAKIAESPSANPAATTSMPVSGSTYPLPLTKTPRTHFLALDKLLPRRDFLQILAIPSKSPLPAESSSRVRFCYDREWLAICRVFEPLDVSGGVGVSQFMKLGQDEKRIAKRIREELKWVNENITDEQLVIPENWEKTAQLQYDDNIQASRQPDGFNNPQTQKFCNMIGIENKWQPPAQAKKSITSPEPEEESSSTKMEV